MRWVVRIGGTLLALMAVAFLGLWIASHRRDAGRMRASVEIARAPEEIWPWITEPAHLKRWVGWLAEVRPDSTSPREGIGHRETWVMNDPRLDQAMLVPGTITVWEPPDQMGVHVEVPNAFQGDVLYKLTPMGNGHTRFEQDGRFQHDNRLASLMEPLRTPDAMRKMFEDMKRLKSMIEAVTVDTVAGEGASEVPGPAGAPADSAGR